MSADAAHPNFAAMRKIDSHTVKKLESMAPGRSRVDARTVHGWVISGEVLREFSEAERSNMWERMQQFDGLIPSLHTFFRDMDYLEACADAVKRLFPLSKTHPTLWSTMSHSYARPAASGDDCLIQASESQLRRRPSHNINHLELAYRQIWLYAMRHYPSMSKDPESNDLLTRPASEKADETVVYEMAVLAQKLGFMSAGIEEIIDQSPDRQIAVDCLLKARKPESYQYSAADLERSVRRIVECFAAATPREQPLYSRPIMTFADKRRARGGLPSQQAQKNDRRFLFIDHLHREVSATEKVSTWFVRRSVYFAFFGRCFSPPPEAPGERTASVANSASPRSPLFVPDDASDGGSDTRMDGPLLVPETEEVSTGAVPDITDTRRLPREASDVAEQEHLRQEAARVATEAAEQERLQRDAIAAEQVRLRREAVEQERREQEERVRIEQERLQKEAERVAADAEQERLQREAQERAAAEAAKQERLEQEAIAAERFRLRREAEERAANEAAQQERLKQIQREAEEQAAEQERIRREAEEQTAEQERLRQNAAERATAEEERVALERAVALAHLEQNNDHTSTPTGAVPLERLSSTTQIDITPDLPSLISQLRETSDPLDEDDNARVGPHALATQNSLKNALPTDDGSPPRTITAGLEPITEEAEVSNPSPSVIIDDDRQRQLREQIAERRRADKEKVANAKREPLEIDDHFTRTRSAEDEDLYEPDEEAVTAPPGRLTGAPVSPDGASEVMETDHAPTAIPAASAPMAASFRPPFPHNTLLEFETIMANAPAWPGNVGPDSSATAEQAPPPASGLARLRRNRNPALKEAKSRRNETSDPRRQHPPLPDDLGADSMIFWVWKANQWREMERVPLDASDPLRALRVALRYERDEPVEFVDRNMHAIAAAKCVQAALAEGTRSIFLLLRDGPLERPITRTMAMAADDLATETPLAQGRKRGR